MNVIHIFTSANIFSTCIDMGLLTDVGTASHRCVTCTNTMHMAEFFPNKILHVALHGKNDVTIHTPRYK